jgi:hypothetical protein
MDPEKLAAWFAVGGTCFATIAWCWRSVRVVRKRMAQDRAIQVQTQKRCSLMWRAFMKRGFAEAVSSGAATQRLTGQVQPVMERDLILSDESFRRFAPIAKSLRKFYRDNMPISKEDFGAMVEDAYGDWLIDNICIPLKVDRGACIAMAVQVAIDTDSDWPRSHDS